MKHIPAIFASIILILCALILVVPYVLDHAEEIQTDTVVVTQEEVLPARILFVGDMMFDRYIRKMSLVHGEDWSLSCSEWLLRNADVVVGNLEGPITDSDSVSMNSVIGSPENFQFTFPPSITSLLRKYNIGIVNIGNNHADDFGDLGRRATKNYLSEANIGYFGGFAGDEPIYRMVINDIPLSFISYNQFGGEKAEVVASRIKEEQQAGQKVIVYTHWGEEYVPPTDRVREIAQLFAESGATLIIGSHPHVVQESEYIEDTLVYYSLGNFIFDQYWMDEVKEGLAVLVTMDAETLVGTEVPVRMERDGRTCPLFEPGR